MQRLVERRWTLADERAHLVDAIAALRGQAAAAPAAAAAALQAACDDCARAGPPLRGRPRHAGSTDVIAEEEAMREAFDRVLALDQVEQRYAGVADPADAALAAAPGAGATPAEVHAWWDGLTRDAAAGGHRRLARFHRQPRRHPARGPRRRQHAWRWTATSPTGDYLEERGLLTADEERWLENARSARDARRRHRAGHRPGRPASRSRASSTPTTRPPSTATAPSPCAAGDLATADNVAVVVPGLRHRRRERGVPRRAGR